MNAIAQAGTSRLQARNPRLREVERVGLVRTEDLHVEECRRRPRVDVIQLHVAEALPEAERLGRGRVVIRDGDKALTGVPAAIFDACSLFEDILDLVGETLGIYADISPGNVRKFLNALGVARLGVFDVDRYIRLRRPFFQNGILQKNALADVVAAFCGERFSAGGLLQVVFFSKRHRGYQFLTRAHLLHATPSVLPGVALPPWLQPPSPHMINLFHTPSIPPIIPPSSYLPRPPHT